MRKFGLAIGLAIIITTQAAASTRAERFEHSLEKLSPIERLVQLCDYTAMKKIGQANHAFRPDRAVGDARASTVVAKDTVAAKGAAFRSHGKWYELSYTCTGTPDHMKVLSFDYRVGSEIPEAKWTSYNLW